MPPSAIRVVDISASAGVPPLACFERIQQPPYDVRGIIIECWNNGPVHNYHACAELADRAGLPRATYCWPPSGATRAIAYVRSERQPAPLFFVLDVERPDGVSAEFCALRREHIAVVREAGLESWVYSSASQWPAIMGSDEGFAHLPLWMAAYVSGANWPDAPPSLPVRAAFGGWTEAQGWQLRGTTLLDGVPVDLSLFDAAAFERPGEEDEMVKIVKESADYTFVTDGVSLSYIDDPQKLRQLQDAGVWPKDIVVVPDGALSTMHRVK